MLQVLKTKQYEKWERSLDSSPFLRIQSRLEAIVTEGFYGDHKHFDGIIELRWGSGMRVYCAYIAPNLVLLLGGNKRAQEKDIRSARQILAQLRQPQR